MLRFLCEFLPRKGFHYQAKALLLLRAWLSRRTFHCTALAGESAYNICINSDLTVSCNCQDFDGRGHLGDLNHDTLEQIFAGATARSFRALLAAGRLPLDSCVHCPELKLIPRREAAARQQAFRLPHRGIMVENTVLCNLRCHLCPREALLGLRKGKHLLSLSDVEKVAALLKECRIESLFFFNLGEPFLPDQICSQLRIIRGENPRIRIITSTNGLLLDRADRIEAALLMDYIYISLDGVSQETVSRYQVGGDFQKSYRNMATLCRLRGTKASPLVEWKYVLFRWNDKPSDLKKAVQLAKSAGVDVLSFHLGGAPPLNKSLRWHYHPFFRTLGQKKNGSIVLNLNNIPQHLLSP